jgi:hypothetical protein
MLQFMAMKRLLMKLSFKHFQFGSIAVLLLAVIVFAYSHHLAQEQSRDYEQPVQIATLENQVINESSGIAASRRNKDIFWTHNDSGDDAFIYAIDRQGKHRGIWRVKGASAQDWEDIAVWKDSKSGKSYIYVGDIGNNSKKREFLTVYRIPEPAIKPADATTTKQNPAESEAAEAIKLKYPEGNFDAETLMIHPQTGDLYIVTKVMGAAAKVFKLKAPFMQQQEARLVQVAEVQVANTMKGFFTGGDISPDGHRVVLCDYLGAFEFILPDKKGIAFDEIWQQIAQPVNLGKRKQGEAICYGADGKSLLATSENLPCPLIEIVRKSTSSSLR